VCVFVYSPVIRNCLFARDLGQVNHGKKSVLDNIGPRVPLQHRNIFQFFLASTGFIGNRTTC
jgi:hypothetical protein